MERPNPILNLVATVGTATISLIATIVIILNFLSGIVGGVWLAILGHWGSIGLGFVIGIAMPWVWTIASLPAMGMSFVLAFFAEKGSKTFTGILGFLTSIYNNALLALWVIWVFGFFIGRADSESFIPYLLWGYSTMMAPLSYMASKEPPDSMGTTLGVFFAQLCYLIWVLYFFFGKIFMPWLYAIIVVGVLFSLFAIVVAIAQMVEEERMKSTRLAYENMTTSYDEDNLYDDEDEIT